MLPATSVAGSCCVGKVDVFIQDVLHQQDIFVRLFVPDFNLSFEEQSGLTKPADRRQRT